MFRPKFELMLSKENFSPSTLICLGSQMILLINFLETKLPAHVWYTADIDANGLAVKKYNLQSERIKKIGAGASLIQICGEIDQFFSGIFLAVKNDQEYEARDIELDTEERGFRTLNLDGVLLEIRAFDTSFFCIFSENANILHQLSEQFKSSLEENNKYTWNDRVSIKKEAPRDYLQRGAGIVCGMSKIVFKEIANKYCSDVGSWIYMVASEDGDPIPVPENYLEKYRI